MVPHRLLIIWTVSSTQRSSVGAPLCWGLGLGATEELGGGLSGQGRLSFFLSLFLLLRPLGFGLLFLQVVIQGLGVASMLRLAATHAH